ncbi:MAG TPA: LppX_LprAFG lipoprotein [Aggregatilineales bacterium]|nr:LppX_LprAFG lipoprotein [Anaerolineales bacterium]HRE49574.1 LppX_LprAFG lipoprotein [Aggregatilineales bacterium]
MYVPSFSQSSRRLIIALCLILALTACGGGGSAATPTVAPTARTLLDKAAMDIQGVASLHFKLQLSGAPGFIDDAKLISFVSADGGYTAPDKVGAKVSAAVSGIPGQIDIVAIGDEQYFKHIVLTGNRWLRQDFSPGFNADKLIRGEDGIKRALNSLREVKLEGVEDLFGVQVYKVSGIASVSEIMAVTAGLIRGTGDAIATIYIRVDTERVERMVLIQPETVTDQYPEPTMWTMEFFDYDDPAIVIDAPAVETPVSAETPSPAATP